MTLRETWHGLSILVLQSCSQPFRLCAWVSSMLLLARIIRFPQSSLADIQLSPFAVARFCNHYCCHMINARWCETGREKDNLRDHEYISVGRTEIHTEMSPSWASLNSSFRVLVVLPAQDWGYQKVLQALSVKEKCEQKASPGGNI